MISKGIFYLLVGSLIGAESLLETVKKDALKRGLVNKGDSVIITTGVNEGLEGSTNLLKIIKIWFTLIINNRSNIYEICLSN